MIYPPKLWFIKLNAGLMIPAGDDMVFASWEWKDTELYINPEDIKYITKMESNTILHLKDNKSWHVKETPEEILTLIATRNEVPHTAARGSND